MSSSASARRCRSRRERAGQEQRGGEEAGAPARFERDLDRLPHGELGEQRARPGTCARGRGAPGGAAPVDETSSPWSSTVPCAGTNPPIAFISVDLPAPLVPMSPTISSSPTSSDTSSTATTPPKRTLMSDDVERRDVRRRSAAAPSAIEHRRRRRRAFGRRRFALRCRPREQGVARRVRDLHEPTGEVQQQDQQAEARVSRGTSVLSGKKAGSPTTHSEPSTAPMASAMPPITTSATSASESVDQEVALGERHRLRRRRRAARRRARR